MLNEKMNNVYNYNDLKSEIEEDVNNGVLELEYDLYVIRKSEPVFEEYRPILDFEYNDVLGESLEKMTVGDCLKEMNQMSKFKK